MKETLPSLASSPIPEAGATDSPWRPSFLHWLISAESQSLLTVHRLPHPCGTVNPKLNKRFTPVERPRLKRYPLYS